jgi:hypothetical protein
MSMVVKFDLAGEVGLRPSCAKCRRTISNGIAHIREKQERLQMPSIDYYCESCAPLWMVEQAKRNEGTRKAGD